ncbi:MAG: hypothetical protein ABSA77_06840 [Thermoguttaceae bacterium]
MTSKTFLLTALFGGLWLAVSPCTAMGQAQDTVKDAGDGHLGILAYGSLIDDPGDEIAAATWHRRKMTTPFSIEFGRSSGTRGGAPTLVPVAAGGAPVNAVLLVLKDSVSEDDAASMLWRRETRSTDSTKRYIRPKHPGPNNVLVESVKIGGVTILYTDFADAGKLKSPTAKQLAEFAVTSAGNPRVLEGCDGISYLISAKKAGIKTPLMPGYEQEILRTTGAATLEEALAKTKASH